MICDVLDWLHGLARGARLTIVANLMAASFIVAGPIVAGLLGSPGLALADSTLDGATLLLRDGFEEGRLSPQGGLFYKDNAEQREGRLTFQDRNVLTGRRAVTLTVSPSCRKTAEACSERAEIWERPEVLAPYGQTVWYGLAMRLDDPLPQDDGRYVMAQWKREILPDTLGDYSPFMALRLYQGHLGVTVETDLIESFPIGSPARPDGCLPGEARVLSRPSVLQTRALVAIESGNTPANYPAYFDSCAPGIAVTRHADLPPAQDGWIDFVFRAQPGPEGDGHVEIIANGTRIATVKGHIGHVGSSLDRNQYFKFGPYRAPNHLPWSVSYDDFRRGSRCADVIRAGQCPLE